MGSDTNSRWSVSELSHRSRYQINILLSFPNACPEDFRLQHQRRRLLTGSHNRVRSDFRAGADGWWPSLSDGTLTDPHVTSAGTPPAFCPRGTLYSPPKPSDHLLPACHFPVTWVSRREGRHPVTQTLDRGILQRCCRARTEPGQIWASLKESSIPLALEARETAMG